MFLCRQLPWLQQDDLKLWISYKNLIRCYQQTHNGHLKEQPNKILPQHTADVCRFVAKDGCLLSGSRSVFKIVTSSFKSD